MLISLISLHIGYKIQVNVGNVFLIPKSDSFTPCPFHGRGSLRAASLYHQFTRPGKSSFKSGTPMDQVTATVTAIILMGSKRTILIFPKRRTVLHLQPVSHRLLMFKITIRIILYFVNYQLASMICSDKRSCGMDHAVNAL